MTIAFPVALSETQELVQPALRKAVARLDPHTQAQASYHLCWTGVDGEPESGGGGKSLRPALALLSARAAGADADLAVPGAVAVELVHNFSLLHDDLMDGDLSRRHRPTVWALWGAASAILVGDAMVTLAQEVLLDVPGPSGTDAARLLAGATQRLIRGQVDDVRFEGRSDVTLEQCLDMAAGKTGSLISASCAIGAVLAGAPKPLVQALTGFGEQLGLAFQLVDDVLGIWGDPELTGKPVLSDLRSRKNSLPVCYALSRGDHYSRELQAWLGDRDYDTESRLSLVAALVEVAGGREWAEQEARRRIQDGEELLASAGVPTAVREELVALGEFVVARRH
ncbi:MAG: geranylgeranyl diphosphate synthase, type [Frankiales bacterium]|nr:geranylgeranyl diphosphate synthase, type [Frankiales bacterium]